MRSVESYKKLLFDVFALYFLRNIYGAFPDLKNLLNKFVFFLGFYWKIFVNFD
jgi:hypothetical protein